MDTLLLAILDNFSRNPGATSAPIQNLISSTGITLPLDYIETLQYMNGGEGFVGQEYFRLYPVDKIVSLNQAYGTNEFAKGLIIFGSNGGGEAFAFDNRDLSVGIVQIPFIPMHFKYIRNYGKTLYECLTQLLSNSPQADKNKAMSPNPLTLGKEIHEIQPVVFGGDPTDPANKAFLSPEEYAPYVVWWNRQYRELSGDDKR